MIYEVIIDKKVDKEIEKLPRDIQKKIVESISRLATEPRPLGHKVLKGEFKGALRIRVANVYRVVYVISDKQVRILIIKVAHRKEVYR